ncbi:ionotropic receptor 75a-like [Culex pipiens pallens]|uniref:ionotropic receptor 75a-like n=1 Tax=Culex pipiens pallens TaxID=42434 RepID=UPI0019532A56|nr:ionotropic receptor 75a-like [Culex pipiens pallens]
MSYSFSGKIHYVDISNLSVTWNHSHSMMSSYHLLGATADLQCPTVSQLFDVISDHGYFNSSYHWLLYGETDSLESASCLLDGQNLNIDAKVTLAVEINRTESGEHYDLFDVYSPFRRRGAKLNVTLVGNWSTGKSFQLASNQTEYERRIDFGGIWLKGAITALDQVHYETLMEHLTSDAPVEAYALHRFGYQIWELIMQKHNFTIKLLQTPSWGIATSERDSHSGIIGQLASKEADLAINTLTYTKDRISIIDHTVTIAMSKMLLVFRHPKVTGNRNLFLRPFEVDAWMAVLGVIVLASIVLFGNFCAESYKEYYDKEVHDNRSLVFLTVFGILCQQGFSSKTMFNSTRITLISTLIFSVLLYQFYSTFIVGYLLIIPPKTMSTLQHLLDSNLKVIVEDLGYNIDFLNQTKDPLATQLYHTKILNGENNFLNVSEGIARVQQGGYAFQCDTAYAYPLMKRTFTDKEICDLQETVLSPFRQMHLPLPKGSPFREMFRVTVRKIVESSVGFYQQKRFFCDKPKCAKSELEPIDVDMDNVSSLFIGMLVCLAGCVGLLMVEWITYSYFKGHGEKLSNID